MIEQFVYCFSDNHPHSGRGRTNPAAGRIHYGQWEKILMCVSVSWGGVGWGGVIGKFSCQ